LVGLLAASHKDEPESMETDAVQSEKTWVCRDLLHRWSCWFACHSVHCSVDVL